MLTWQRKVRKLSLPAEITNVDSVRIGNLEETFAKELSGAVRDLTIWKEIEV